MRNRKPLAGMLGVAAAGALVLLVASGGGVRAETPPSVPTQAEQDAFEAAQWAMLSSAGTALQQLGLRAAAGAPDLSRLVRKRQDLVALAGLREDEMQSADDAARMVALRGEIDSIHAEIAGIDATLAEDFPRYAELANPAPLSVAAVQSLLEDDEGLVVVLGGKDEVFTFAVTRERFAWSRTGYGAWLLAEEIQALRAQLDPNSAQDRGARPLREDLGPRIAAFDRGRAHFLYRALLGGVAPALAGKRHLFTVADGPFASLPLSLLVEQEPEGRDTDPEAIRNTDWLIKRFALTTLPTVGSLAVVREHPASDGTVARVPFAGFGAPVLGGQRAPVAVAAAESPSFFRGALADVEAVRNLAPLPQTGPELMKLSNALGGDAMHLFLGARATEAAVKEADLSGVDVLAFATHGLLTGDLEGLAEPALVLTPPEAASRRNDGLLTASEIAELKLSAQWVILSACNTAAGDGRPDAEGLSGLARAFLYAGTRAILVSHWPVRDDAAARLTTGTLGLLGTGESVRRAEALRQSMLALMADTRDPSLAHPSAWAPFVVVGEGGY